MNTSLRLALVTTLLAAPTWAQAHSAAIPAPAGVQQLTARALPGSTLRIYTASTIQDVRVAPANPYITVQVSGQQVNVALGKDVRLERPRAAADRTCLLLTTNEGRYNVCVSAFSQPGDSHDMRLR